MANWTIQFKNLQEDDVVVTIGGATTDTELKPGESPLTIDGTDDEDILCPMRTQSGKLQIVLEDETVLSEIMSSNPLSRPVTVTVDGDTAWTGYLKTDAPDMTLWGVNSVVSLPVICPLTALNGIPISKETTNGGMMQSVQEFIAYISTQLSDTVSSVQYDSDLKFLCFDRSLWLEEKELTDRTSLTDIWDDAMCGDVLTDICQSLGLCAEMNGNVMCLVDKTAASSTTSNLSSFSFASTDHTLAYVAGKNKVKASCSIEAMSTDFLDTDIESQCALWGKDSGASSSDHLNYANLYNSSRNITSKAPFDLNGVSLEKWNYDRMGTSEGTYYWGTELEDQGPVTEDDGRYTLSKEFRMVLVRMSTTPSIASTLLDPLHIIAKHPISLPGNMASSTGFKYRLQLTATVKKRENAVEDWETPAVNNYILAKVKFGDYYLICDDLGFDGEGQAPGWKSTEQLCWLNVTDEGNLTIYDGEFEDMDGVLTGGSGTLEIWLYPPIPTDSYKNATYPSTYYSTYATDKSRQTYPYTSITNLKAELIKVKDVGSVEDKSTTNKYETTIGNAFQDEYSISNKLTLLQGTKYGKACWMTVSRNVYSYAESALGQTNMEQYLVTKAANYYAQARERLQVEVTSCALIDNTQTYTYGGKNFAVLSQSIDFRDCKNKITLQEIIYHHGKKTRHQHTDGLSG